MKIKFYILAMFLACFIQGGCLTSVQAQTASQTADTTSEPVFTATVKVNSSRRILIEFSQQVSLKKEKYQLLSASSTGMTPKPSALMTRLYNEPGLIASQLTLEDNTVDMLFKFLTPTELERNNIINRVVMIVYNELDDEGARLEVNGYNPLLGMTIPNLRPNLKVRPPNKIIKPD